MNMKSSRVKNSLRNSFWGLIQKVVLMVGPFVVRTVLIYVLSAEYSGLNSLFASILQILSLSELGFSNAIVYSMYKPIAEDDYPTISALLNYFKKVYRIIGIVILGVGIILMPFLPFLIKGDVPADISLYTLFGIYLINTVVSYFLFGYKSSVLAANQRQDITSKNSTIVHVIVYVLQVSLLLLTSNYYCYIIVLPISTIALNILNSKAVDKLFPEIQCRGKISDDLKSDIKKQVTGLLLWKIGGSTRNTLDSIIISSFIGLTAVAIYNNYYFVMNAVISIFSIVSISITAGVGNKIVTSSVEENYKDFCKFNFIYMWGACWASTCLLCLYQPFMRMWMGADMMLDFSAVVLFCLYFFILKTGDINSVYYQACGLWYEGRYRAIIESVLNLVLNVVLGYLLGITGIILATIISMLCIWFYGSGIVFKKYFKMHRPSEFYISSLKFLIIASITGGITYLLCYTIPDHFFFGSNVLELVTKLIICVLSNIILWLLMRSNVFYNPSKVFVKSILRSIFNRSLKTRGV